ncbi:MAG: ankyrin repeat domain-containing protein [Janthinobacterium lividum]
MLDHGLNGDGKGRGLLHFSVGNIKLDSSGIQPRGIGPTDIIKLLIAHGADVNFKVNTYVNGKTGEGVTALMQAAGSNQIGTVQLLLADGADIQATDPDGATALIYAVESSNAIPLLKLLISCGLNVNVQPKHGENALQRAADIGHFENVKFLLAHGAHINAKDDSGKTALKYARAGLAASHNDSYVKIIALLNAAGAKN